MATMIAENYMQKTDLERSYINVEYCNENIKDVYSVENEQSVEAMRF